MTKSNQIEVSVMSQYIKDLSFENFQVTFNKQLTGSPEYEINLNVRVENEKNTIAQSILHLYCEARQNKSKLYILEIEYGGNFEIKTNNYNQKRQILMTECTKLLFPFLRRLAYDITRESGFIPLNLKPIDFTQVQYSS